MRELVKSFRKMQKYIRPRFWRWLSGGLADILGLALYSVSAASSIEYFVNAIAQRSIKLMKIGFYWMAVAIILMFIFEGYYKKFFGEALAFIKKSLCKDVFEALLSENIRNFDKKANAQKLAHLNRDVEKAVSMVGEKLLSFLSAGVMAFVSIIAIAFKSPAIGGMCAVLFAGVLVLNSYFALKQTVIEKTVLYEIGQFNNLYKDDFEGAVTIRTNNLKPMIDFLFLRQNEKYLKIKKSQRNLGLIQELLSGGLSRWMAFGPVLIAISACAAGRMSVGSVFFIFQFAMNLVGYAGQLFDGFSGLGKAAAGVERIWNILSSIPEKEPAKESLTTIESLKFKNVHIIKDHRQIPESFDLSLKRGEIGILAGKSGCGKSTCLLSFMSFIHFSGEIYVNGINIQCYDPASLYKMVSYIEQNPVLFDGTIYENILYGNMEAKSEDIFRAAKMACIADEIERLPKKYDTPVGEGGYGLSGGQRQRIVLARAFLRNSPVMIWDECTSAVDEQTEAQILRNIKAMKNDKIIVMAAHRKSVIELADKLVKIGG